MEEIKKQFIKNRSSSLNLIKILAVIAMIVDHSGVFFQKMLSQDTYYILREIGRFAYPAFAFVLVINFLYNTSDKKRYLTRVLIFAVIAQPFFYLISNQLYMLNVFFTFYIGLLGILIYQERSKWFPFYIFLIWLLLHYMNINYGLEGLLIIWFMFLSHEAIVAFYTNKSIKTFLYLYLSFMAMSFFIVTLSIGYEMQTILGFTLAMIIFTSKIGIKKRLNKYIFYAFYPLHIGILKGLTIILQGGH